MAFTSYIVGIQDLCIWNNKNSRGFLFLFLFLCLSVLFLFADFHRFAEFL